MTEVRVGALVLVLTSIISNPPFANAKVSCKSATGKDVDWFVVYKIPKAKRHFRSFMQPRGGEMAYYDSTSTASRWTLLSSDINNETNNPIAYTLKPIYDEYSKIAYLAYNDQLPDGFTGRRGGHTKGVLMAGNNVDLGAVWLQHSVPRFVDDVEKGYVYPSSGRANGQLFFCVTFPLATVETISYHLQLQEAKVYQSRYLPWTAVFRQFSSLLKEKYMKNAKSVRVDVLHTRKGIQVLAIAKSPRWLNDIYTEELSRLINDSMTVQTWRKGAGGAQNQHCSATYSVTDVEEVGVRTHRGVLAFSSREDHSKWSVARSRAVFCFSSLNRMISQWKRGGEITCISDMSLANLFRNSISKRNKCRAER